MSFGFTILKVKHLAVVLLTMLGINQTQQIKRNASKQLLDTVVEG